ncbi:DNA-directed DNA polymerase gamma mip1 [Mortierella sp. NVP85]|nr:DNA-directed DNA polymerase gamma mip1 [Mortierella sp. NVP85]
MAKSFANIPVHTPPKKWLMQPGWTRYGKDGTVTAVEYPTEKMLTFDVETVPSLSKYPVMACALSSEAWYGWVSPWLMDPVKKGGQQNDQHLLPFGPSQDIEGQERILVGHNVGYDRARILEEYNMELNGIRYLDTMSLHIAVSGLCSQQRPAWLKYKKALEEEDEAYIHALKDTTGKYFDVSSINSLLQVAKFHCGIIMDKAPRDILMEAQDIGLVQQHFEDLMTYCARDVSATHDVYRVTLPKFLDKCPHPVSFAGILQMGSSFLTVDEGWTAYLERCDEAYKTMVENVESKLLMLADKALEDFAENPTLCIKDPWLSQLDWTVPPSARLTVLPGKPTWYRKHWDSPQQKVKFTTRQKAAPLLLKLQWRGYPLVYSNQYGWTFRVPKDDPVFETKVQPLTFRAENEAGYQATIDPKNYHYYRIPHKSGEGANVGNPLAKGYISHFESNVLSCSEPKGEPSSDTGALLAKQALDMNAQCAYWISARERIKDQFVVWDKDTAKLGRKMGMPKCRKGHSNGMILPQIVTMGTVTRRAVEKTWMTASNAKKNRIGSELKSMIKAPAGYKIVGADVDSEELWISSLMGDSQFRMHGATALGWMTLQGTKSAGTDLHSKTAQILGINRDQAKIFNYGRIYGAGVKFAAQLMQQFNSTIDATDALKRAADLYAATKGTKDKRPDYELVTDRPYWRGGTESYMFNSMEKTATSEDPRTPALGCAITDALKPKYAENLFMTSRVNWVVQSSGVDYLHLLLVSMNYLIKKYNIKARFMLCVHDEVRYMVREKDVAKATLALQVSNLWTRALFSYRLGIHDLPQSVAFFSAVDVDHVFRKEVNMDCVTPTQTTAIPHGESLTIEDVLEQLKGKNLGNTPMVFKDAAEDPIPENLRFQDRFEALKAAPDVDPSLASSTIEEAEQARDLYLEAQSLGTLKEVKAAIARRAAEAKAALEEKRKAELAALGMGQGDDSSGEGNEGKRNQNVKARAPKKIREKKPTRPLVPARPVQKGIGHMTVGQWGMKNPSPERLEELDRKAARDPLPDETKMTLPKRTDQIIPREAADDLISGLLAVPEKDKQTQLAATSQQELADHDVDDDDDELSAAAWLEHFTKIHISSKSPPRADPWQHIRCYPFPTGYSSPASCEGIELSGAIRGRGTKDSFHVEDSASAVML